VGGCLTSRRRHHHRGFAATQFGATQWRLFERSGEIKPLLYALRVLLTGVLMEPTEPSPNLANGSTPSERFDSATPAGPVDPIVGRPDPSPPPRFLTLRNERNAFEVPAYPQVTAPAITAGQRAAICG
jgi:hypothetical protein